MDLGALAFDMTMFPLERAGLKELRGRLIGRAQGQVLEIGVGTGANLPFYDKDRVESLTCLDLGIREKVLTFPFPRPIHFEEGRAEELPFDTDSFDTVVSTLVFCTVGDPDAGYAQIRRVLRPGGRLIFVEHVQSHRPGLARFMNYINPAWRRLSSGCNINRHTIETMRRAGFDFEMFGTRGDGLLVYGIAVPDASMGMARSE